MKTVVWYLPSGAGGMAAYYKSTSIRKQLAAWSESKGIVVDLKTQLTTVSENGLRYYQLTIRDEDAIIFALSWDNSIPKFRYEYIK